MPREERLWLTVGAPFYHGSTALEMLFMSSRRVSTICAAGTWQCEARWCLEEHAFAARAGAPPGTVGPWPCPSPNAIRHDVPGRLRCHLETYSRIWNLSRPVLLTKWAPLHNGGGCAAVAPDESGVGLDVAPPPALLRAYGVERVRWAVVMMIRPYCLWRISSHARSKQAADAVAYAREELRVLEQQSSTHRAHLAAGRRVLLTSLADILFRPDSAAARIRAFAPCLGRLDPDFFPTLGVDISEGNHFKVGASVAVYGASLSPLDLGYDVEAGACVAPRDELYQGLLPAEARRAEEAEAYLRDWSWER